MVRIADPDAHVEEVGAVGQPQVHLEGQVAQPFPLPQPQHLAAVRRRDTGGVQWVAGEGGVAGRADVPFDAAGEPGAVEGEGRGLAHRVAVEQFTAGGLVVQGVHPAAEAGQDGGAQPVVLDDQRLVVDGSAGAAVAVAHPGRQDRAQRRTADLPCHVGGQPGVPGISMRCPSWPSRSAGRVVGAEGAVGRVRVVRRTLVTTAASQCWTGPPRLRRPPVDHGTACPPVCTGRLAAGEVRVAQRGPQGGRRAARRRSLRGRGPGRRW